MKKYGIVIAIQRELIALLQSEHIQYETLGEEPFTVYHFEMTDKEMYAICSGAGEVDAALATQYLITTYHVDMILNYGVVGALVREVAIGELLAVEKIYRHDVDFSFEGTTPGYYTDMHGEPFCTASAFVAQCRRDGLPIVTLASGDQFIASSEKKAQLRDDFQASICDMEGAGIARACQKYNVPMFSVKCISDSLDGDIAEEFDKYVYECGQKSFDYLIDLLRKV